MSVREDDRSIFISAPHYDLHISKETWSVCIYPKQLGKVSRHQALVLSFIEKLEKLGIRDYNADGIEGRILNRSLSLACGQARADVAYRNLGELCHAEIETTDKLGHQTTGQQLIKLATGQGPLLLVVPLAAQAEAHRILKLLNLAGRIYVDGV